MSVDLNTPSNQKRVQDCANEIITAWKNKGRKPEQCPTLSQLKDWVEFMICSGNEVSETEVWKSLTRDQRQYFQTDNKELQVKEKPFSSPFSSEGKYEENEVITTLSCTKSIPTEGLLVEVGEEEEVEENNQSIKVYSYPSARFSLACTIDPTQFRRKTEEVPFTNVEIVEPTFQLEKLQSGKGVALCSKPSPHWKLATGAIKTVQCPNRGPYLVISFGIVPIHH